jgi:DNA-3-methyladenine glycosylase I
METHPQVTTADGAATANPVIRRCAWAGTQPLYVEYHDQEWGVPVHDDRLLFEFLVLEGAQAGLSWLTILKKREGYRAAFAGFDAEKVARFGPADVDRLLSDPGIVRNRLKVESAVNNAKAFLRVQEGFGSFDEYVWRFVDGETIQSSRRTVADIPVKTAEAEILSVDLKRRGFRFVGPTIMYAHMQATGMVNDHTVECYRWAELGGRG